MISYLFSTKYLETLIPYEVFCYLQFDYIGVIPLFLYQMYTVCNHMIFRRHLVGDDVFWILIPYNYDFRSTNIRKSSAMGVKIVSLMNIFDIAKFAEIPIF